MGKVRKLFNDQMEKWSRMDGYKEHEIFTQEQEMEHTNKLMTISTTKMKTKVFIEKIQDEVLDGIIDPLTAYVTLHDIKTKLENVTKNIKDLAIEESSKYGKTFDYHGYTVTNKDGAKRFDYSNVPEIVELEKHLKERKEFYKKAKLSADAGGWSDIETLPDGTTREVFQDSNNELLVCPVIKYGSASITITNLNK